MQATQDQLKKCPLCENEIEIAKFRLHEVMCARNNYKCQKCGQVVLKADKEQHELDVHTEKPDISCPACSEFTAKTQGEIAQHQKESCINRLVPCKYCETLVELSKVEEHTQYCGSKTQ